MVYFDADEVVMGVSDITAIRICDAMRGG